jgi:hypothetical protein
MPIRDESELERAMQEYHELRHAPAGSPEARRRDEIDAEIKAYSMQHMHELTKGRPHDTEA